MKRILRIAACLMLAVLLAVSVSAAGNVKMTLSADKTSLQAGGSVVITVAVDEMADCKSGGLSLSYDSGVFERAGNEWLISGTVLADPSGDAVFAYTDAVTVSGNVYRFTLNVKSSAPAGSYDVGVVLTLKDSAGSVTTLSKTITITVACTHSYDNSCDTTCNTCGEKRSVTHSWNGGEVSVNATCNGEGEKLFTCTVCGKTKTETIAKTGHSWNSGKITTSATCTAAGVKTYTCTVCGTTKTEGVEKTGHSWDSGKVTTEATCTSTGVKTFTCGTCGGTKTETVAKTEHLWDGGTVVTEASCSAEGAVSYTCTACAEVKEEVIPMLEHTFSEEGQLGSDETGHWSLCVSCGAQGETAEHEFTADCDGSCDLCGYLRETEIAHVYSEAWSSDENGHWHACGTCGEPEEVIVHTPGDIATDTADQICTDCGYVLALAGSHEHSYEGEWFFDEGTHWQLCVCGGQSAPQSHVWDEMQEDLEAGVVYAQCLECGYQLSVPVSNETEPSTEATEPGKPSVSISIDPLTILKVVLGTAVIGFVIYVIIGMAKSRRQVGKFSAGARKTSQREETAEETVEETVEE